MFKFRRTITLFFCLISLTLPSFAKSISILCLGDSITLGASGSPQEPAPGGYRDYLVKILNHYGYDVNMLGPIEDNPSVYLQSNQATHHAGFGGYRVDELDANLDGSYEPWPGNAGGYWLTGVPGVREAIYPDFILLMAGTNDILQSTDLNTLTNRLNHLMGKLVLLRPQSHIVIAMIPPIFSPENSQRVKDYNFTISQMVEWYSGQGYSVSLVDNYHYFLDKGWGFADAVHPNAWIYNVMGYGWSQGVLKALENQKAYA